MWGPQYFFWLLLSITIAHLPESFDWCEQGWCTPTWNQYSPQYCGSCWIHAALSAVSDRIRGYNNGEGPSVLLSRQEILDCGHIRHLGNGCDGGDGSDAYKYLQLYGLPSETCNSYIATSRHICSDYTNCFDCRPIHDNFNGGCVAVPSKYVHRYYVKDYYEVKGEVEMMTEIFKRGPISCGVALSEHWYQYGGGIFIDNRTKPEIGHDVEIVGWGIDPKTRVKFWRGKNSQGDFWGENGYFRILRGVDNARIESDCMAGILDANRTTAPLSRSPFLIQSQTLISYPNVSPPLLMGSIILLLFLIICIGIKECKDSFYWNRGNKINDNKKMKRIRSRNSSQENYGALSLEVALSEMS